MTLSWESAAAARCATATFAKASIRLGLNLAAGADGVRPPHRPSELFPVILAHDVSHILIVFIADVFENFRVGHQRGMSDQRKGPGVGARVIDDDLEVE